MGGIGVEEATAVGAEHLDRLLGSDRAHGQRLGLRGDILQHRVAGGVLDGIAGGIGLLLLVGHRRQHRRVLVAAEVLDHTLADQGEGEHERNGQQDVERRSGDVGPEIADRLGRWRASPRISAIATTMPVAADMKFCTASPAICVR